MIRTTTHGTRYYGASVTGRGAAPLMSDQKAWAMELLRASVPHDNMTKFPCVLALSLENTLASINLLVCTSKEDSIFGRIMFEELSIVIVMQHQHVSKVGELSESVFESMRSEVLRWIAWIERLAKANSIDNVNWQ